MSETLGLSSNIPHTTTQHPWQGWGTLRAAAFSPHRWPQPRAPRPGAEWGGMGPGKQSRCLCPSLALKPNPRGDRGAPGGRGIPALLLSLIRPQRPDQGAQQLWARREPLPCRTQASCCSHRHCAGVHSVLLLLLLPSIHFC